MFPTRAATYAEARLRDLCGRYLREPVMVTYADPDTFTFVFDPPLTTAEETAYAQLQGSARTAMTDISPSEWSALQPKVAEIRSFRTRTMAQWNALSAANREADEIAYLNDLTDVLRAMLRDG